MLPIKLKLPEHFLDEEIRSGYTVSSKMKKVWAVELDLVVELLRVCEKYGIKIFASGGNMLGAVRHGGFIPWDDDIDMMMLREEYEELCAVAGKEFTAPYFFQTEYTDPGSLRGHAQLRNSLTTGILVSDAPKKRRYNQGIFIDIFPLDNVPDDAALAKRQEERRERSLRFARKVASVSSRYRAGLTTGLKGSMKKAVHYVLAAADPNCKLEQSAFRRFERICTKYNDTPSEMVSVYALGLKKNLLRRRCWLEEEGTSLPFEFITLPVIKEYKAFLTGRYGDYMKPVMNASIHSGLLFDPERPYTEYLD